MKATSNGTSPTLALEASDVTGNRLLEVMDVQRSTPAGAVAGMLSQRMALPDNIPWSLRDSHSRVLDDNRPIGDQVEPGERVTVYPKAHLG